MFVYRIPCNLTTISTLHINYMIFDWNVYDLIEIDEQTLVA